MIFRSLVRAVDIIVEHNGHFGQPAVPSAADVVETWQYEEMERDYCAGWVPRQTEDKASLVVAIVVLERDGRECGGLAWFHRHATKVYGAT